MVRVNRTSSRKTNVGKNITICRLVTFLRGTFPRTKFEKWKNSKCLRRWDKSGMRGYILPINAWQLRDAPGHGELAALTELAGKLLEERPRDESTFLIPTWWTHDYVARRARWLAGHAPESSPSNVRAPLAWREKENAREREGRKRVGWGRQSKGGNESSAMLLEYRLPSSVETLLKPPVVGRQRDGKEGERETCAIQKGHRVHRALRATTRARTRVELAAKVMTSKGSLTSARQISITAHPPVYPLHQHPFAPVPFSLPLVPNASVLSPPVYTQLFLTGLETQVLSIICLSTGPRQIVRTLSIDSLRLVHFMIDYYDCVCNWYRKIPPVAPFFIKIFRNNRVF